ncbi:caax amino terminal protease family protein [Anaeramoeba flamelloides]|uniref:Caax amino terminal protease family protein n=1 Tax=Anaeramoeba flamelloides TaxID=1746091 RepID=A0ABQ8YE89_9EUKA|nr:caax amino terminal protease family protein [Anaeramoeba flamelloides]
MNVPSVYTTVGSFGTLHGEPTFSTTLPALPTATNYGRRNLVITGFRQPKLKKDNVFVVVFIPQENDQLEFSTSSQTSQLLEKWTSEPYFAEEEEEENEQEQEMEEERERERRFLFEQSSSNFPYSSGISNKKENNQTQENRNQENLPTSDTGLMITLASFVAMYFLASLLTPFMKKISLPFRHLLTACIKLVLLSGPVLYLVRTKSSLGKVLRLQIGKSNLRIIFMGILNICVLTACVFVCKSLLIITSKLKPDIQHHLIIKDPVHAIWGFFSFAVFPVFCEELTFRGFFQKTVETHYRYRKALLISAFFFSFMYFDFSFFGFMYKFFLGYFFGILTVYTDSCFPSLISNIIHNGMIIVFANFHHTAQPKHKTKFIYSCIFTTIILGLSFWKFFSLYPISKLEKNGIHSDEKKNTNIFSDEV